VTNEAFCPDRAEGAEASAMLCTLIETVKANYCEPYSYLRHIFEYLPAAKPIAYYEALLPWNVDMLYIMLRYTEVVDQIFTMNFSIKFKHLHLQKLTADM
jgi:hypothetical protein